MQLLLSGGSIQCLGFRLSRVSRVGVQGLGLRGQEGVGLEV